MSLLEEGNEPSDTFSALKTVGFYCLAILGGYLLQEILMYLYSLIVYSEHHEDTFMRPQFARLDTPLKQRAQMLGLLLIVLLAPVLICLNLWIIYISFRYPYVLALYSVYVCFIIFDRTSYNGGRSQEWLRNPRWLKYFRQYFPASLVAMKDLDPKNRYLFGYHPHGIIALSVWANFASDHEEYKRYLKGIDLRIVTLQGNFYVPFFRELLLSCGFIGASRASIVSALNANCSVMVVIGGAAESLHAMPGNTNVVLKNRRGFVKLALETGSHLVPCYGFGENELFNQSRRPWVRRIQSFMKRKMGWVLPLFSGRGIFSYNFGLLPHRIPLTSVIGEPIPCPHIPNPTPEDIEIYFKLYIKGLKSLYSKFKVSSLFFNSRSTSPTVMMLCM